MPRFTRRRFVIAVATVGTLGQIPGAALAAALVGPRIAGSALPWVVACCALVSAPLAVRLWLGNPDRSERGLLGALLVAFYAWWATSILAGAVWPLLALVTAAAGAPRSLADAAALLVGAAFGLSGVSLRRTVARLEPVEVRIDGLPEALDGYTIAQLSDLHMGGHTPPERVRRWVDRVNALEADLVAVTGDLITSGNAFVDRVAEELGRLRARDGVAMCMGNHDYFADHRRLIGNLEAQGIEVLRNRGRLVERGGARYWLAGVDDTWQRRQDVAAAMAGRPDGAPAIVLAHDPLLFPECAARGADLVLSGHTHGGQIALPIFPRTLNLARLRFRHTAGYYREGRAHLVVSRGTGTTGPPIRIGSPSEIVVITLRRG